MKNSLPLNVAKKMKEAERMLGILLKLVQVARLKVADQALHYSQSRAEKAPNNDK